MLICSLYICFGCTRLYIDRSVWLAAGYCLGGGDGGSDVRICRTHVPGCLASVHLQEVTRRLRVCDDEQAQEALSTTYARAAVGCTPHTRPSTDGFRRTRERASEPRGASWRFLFAGMCARPVQAVSNFDFASLRKPPRGVTWDVRDGGNLPSRRYPFS